LSGRHDQPFVSLNCAALPKDLVESELFGYEKGAFTGALRRKPGRFELADGGTLFLDEVGDMALETQAKLLRVLEENEAVRVGGDKPYRFDVRIVAATNKDLQEEIRENRFREDLFFRLNVIPLHVPPLKERIEDISLLARHFLKRQCEQSGVGRKEWDEKAMDVLKSYHWPGNVRELKNFIERLTIMSDGEVISAEGTSQFLSVPDVQKISSVSTTEGGLPLKEMMKSYEKHVLERGFRDAEGNVSKLARMLKIDRANLHRKLKAYGIK
jgi:two-component system nitrogen regulation response regulator NtrX